MTLGYEAQIAVEGWQNVPIDSIRPHPQNPRKHRVEMIARSLQQFGQRSPVVVQKGTGLILKGNGTWQSAKLLGWSEIAIILSDLQGDEAMAYMLADNRPSDLASYDRKRLRDGLAQMIAGPGLNATMWGDDEFQDLDEEFKGIATLPEKGGPDAQPTEAATVSPDPAKKMRQVPFTFSSAEHALFTEWLSQLKAAFGTSDMKATVYEAVRRQAVAEGGGHVQTGLKAPEQVPGQVGLEEVLAEAEALPELDGGAYAKADPDPASFMGF